MRQNRLGDAMEGTGQAPEELGVAWGIAWGLFTPFPMLFAMTTGAWASGTSIGGRRG